MVKYISSYTLNVKDYNVWIITGLIHVSVLQENVDLLTIVQEATSQFGHKP